MDLELLKRFYIVAQEGSLTKAAHKIRVAQSALTRCMQLFEHQMKTTLFQRTPRGVQLTPQGERLYDFAKQLIEQTDTFEKIFHEKEDDISGELKIVTMPFCGAKWLAPSLKGFLEQYPDLNVKILLRMDALDITEGDVLICPLIPHQPHLIQKYLYTAHIKLFASQEYLDKYGIPKTPKDLNHHRLIAYRSNYNTHSGNANWILNIGLEQGEPPRKSYFEIDSLDGICNSALEGYGIAQLPDFSIASRTGLREVLPEISGPEVKMYYVFSNNREKSKKIKYLFDFLLLNVSQWKGRDA